MKTNLIAAAISVVMLSSCAGMMSMPETTAEFRKLPQVKKQSYTVPRSLDAVVASLDKARKCVADESVQTRMGAGGMVSTSRDVQYMTIERASRSRAELVYRWAMSGGIMQPKGGYLVLVGDLEAQGSGTTKVTLHHGSGRDELINALKEWSKGKDQSCHGVNGKA